MDFHDKIKRLEAMSTLFCFTEKRAVFISVKMGSISDFHEFVKKHGIIVKLEQTARVGQVKLSEAETMLFSDKGQLIFPSLFVLLL